ncbi:MAG: bifunctional diguanylate cyclase/phosphodiesterase [Pyrinomonadaceae bacterium]
MLSKDTLTKIYVALLSVLALGAAAWAGSGITAERIDGGLVALVTMTIFCSCFLRLRLPRVKFALTLSDGFIITVMLLYSGEAALLLAVIETLLSSLSARVQGVRVKLSSVVVDAGIASVSVFVMVRAVTLVFGSVERIMQRDEPTSFVWLLVVAAATLLVSNSLLMALYSWLTQDLSFGTVWLHDLFGNTVTYVTAAVVAALSLKALRTTNVFVFTGGIVLLGVVYLVIRSSIANLRTAVDRASNNARGRADRAENTVSELQQYVAELEQTTESLQESHENFRRAAYHDALTGLPNRNYFIDTLKGLLKQTRENSESNFAVLFLDLKSFKTINDSLGHSMGDRLIKNVATRVSGMIREADLVGRFSGDKFGIILTDLLSRDGATGFADRLAKRLAEPYTLDGRQVFTSAKIGIAYGNSKYPEAEDILRDADIAMYYAKDNKENYVIFDQKMHIRAVTRLQLETDLRFAIERNEFELFYQPIIGLDTASLVGFEALVRWNHPHRGLVPPNEFIPISEATGLIIPMTVQILHAACSQLVKWQEASQSSQPLSVAVNLSGKHFGHPALVEQINTVIAETGIDPASLKLELTESAVMDNAETAILMLKQIKETGVQISIDDFGTGYSSLSYLHRFPIDLLKVDRSFVSAMEENSENGEIVRTVIALAKALNLKVVAEGIESIHQFHQLRILGCEYGQGYLFSKPLPVADIERLLNDNSRWQSILPQVHVITPVRDNTLLRLAQ